ncbi:uncharacterized protein F5891DRAFT_986810 [Suillus fuscotomentosus]|uniref:DUF6535 domain-containing protein n=1 Tax=Suillus fuscotomentosus TaxID=1912939 RepID=A0AAD4HDC1_9AGAM|nr:uncharacterized protein F5891DRAFT_986810 [Suillus fuscotomentosus]KAG1890717.1 hypothetical protein F5891DRAFT_986810 [Suillus fuscotomentosus]
MQSRLNPSKHDIEALTINERNLSLGVYGGANFGRECNLRSRSVFATLSKSLILFQILLALVLDANMCSFDFPMSEASNTYGVEDRRAHNDEQPPPEQDTVGPTKDLELNDGPSQSSEPHKQESNFKYSPDGGLASEAENVAVQKDQPNLSELCPPGFGNCFEECQGPSLLFLGGVQKSLGGIRCHVLRAMQRRLDIVLVFHIFYRGDGAQSPSDTTNLLLTQLEQIGLRNLTAAGSAAPASTWLPPTSMIWIQIIAYASLSTSLLAAFGTVLDKQWLRYHKSNKYGRGSQKERGKLRQEKFDGLVMF